MMDPFDIKEVLDSFTIIIDTREQPTQKYQERCQAFGKWKRTALAYGDYSYDCTLPDGSQLYGIQEKALLPKCVIERKMDLTELAMCLGRERKRFEREMQRAADHGARIFLLIENGSWEGIINHRYRSKLHPSAFFASLTAWMIRYNMNVVFCREGTSGKLIREILYRDLKERLETGAYG